MPGACLSEVLPTDKSDFVDRAEKPWKLFHDPVFLLFSRVLHETFRRVFTGISFGWGFLSFHGELLEAFSFDE